MINRISKWFYEKSNGWVAAIGLLVFVLFSLTVLPDQNAQAASYSAGAGSPDTSLFYGVEDLYHMAEAYGSTGRQVYVQARFSFDLAFPLIYTFFLVTGISWLLERLLAHNSPWRCLNLLPLGAMLLDFLENICAATVVGAYPNLKSVAALLASILTPFKWLLVAVSFLTLAAAGIMALLRLIQSRRNISKE